MIGSSCFDHSLDSIQRADIPDHLVSVSYNLSPDNTVVVLANPALFVETLQGLTNPDYIKLCCDGTCRLIEGGWVLINLRLLSKHHAPVADVYAFPSTYAPLLFALANKESDRTYQSLFAAAARCARVLLGLDLPPRVCQCHCDWHFGENAARLECFPQSERVADFAHFLGACVRPRQPSPTDDTVQAFRKGFPHTMQKYALDKTWVPYLVGWVHILRSCPSALLFHAVVERLLECMLSAEVPFCKLMEQSHGIRDTFEHPSNQSPGI